MVAEVDPPLQEMAISHLLRTMTEDTMITVH